MCLGELVQVSRVIDGTTAEVTLGARVTTVSLMTLDEPVGSGDWVLVHSGFALSRLSADEARQAARLRGSA